MGNSNVKMAHSFYYEGVNKGKSRYNQTMKFDGRTAYSYNTVVAMVIPTKGHVPEDISTDYPSTGITLLSASGMTNTTRRHISLYVEESPFEVVRVPMVMGCGNVLPKDLPRLFYDELSALRGEISRKPKRKKFIDLLRQIRTIEAMACDEWSGPLRSDRKLDEFRNMDISGEVSRIQEANRRLANKKASETRKLFAKYVKDRTGCDYLEFVRSLFDRPYSYRSEKYPFSDEERRAIKDKMFGRTEGSRVGAPAYVWLDGENVVTSKGVSVPKREAEVALKAWASGKDMRSFKVGQYAVVSYQGDVIRIGCHRIPRDNMLALYEAVIGKPFPCGEKEIRKAPATKVNQR